MKGITISICLLFFSIYCFAQTDDIATLKKLNSDWIGSYVTRDTVTMAEILGDDMVLISPNGREFHKKEMLLAMMWPGQDYLTSKVDTVSVRIAGNIGLVNVKATVTVKTEGMVNTVQTCYLDVYEKRQGRWYATASQVAMLK